MSPLGLELARGIARLCLSAEDPGSAESTRYIEFIENHHDTVYPLLGLMALALIVVGIITAWRTQGMDGTQKASCVVAQDVMLYSSVIPPFAVSSFN